MKINVEISAQDLANVSRKNLEALMISLQGFACDETEPALTALVSIVEPAAKAIEKAPESETKAVTESVMDAKKETRTAKREKKTAPNISHEDELKKEEPVESKILKETPEPDAEEPVAGETETDADTTQEVDRETVQSRLKEIATSGKSKEIKALLKSYNIKRFSDLPDDKLAEVLNKAEAL